MTDETNVKQVILVLSPEAAEAIVTQLFAVQELEEELSDGPLTPSALNIAAPHTQAVIDEIRSQL
jgi:hypothetical protein